MATQSSTGAAWAKKIDELSSAQFSPMQLDLSQTQENQSLTSLKSKHKLYSENQSEWEFMLAAYEGSSELLSLGKIEQHEREGSNNWARRKKELYGFSYTKSVIDLFTFYLFKREPKRELGSLAEYDAWQNFIDDCNLYGDGFNEWLLEQGRYAAIYGHMGVLVDKASGEFITQAEERTANIYPYVAAYHPLNILDWEYEKDQFNRPVLSYLKIKDDDGVYRLWWPDRWELWREATKEEQELARRAGQGGKAEDMAVQLGEGINTLGEIPFVWLYNLRSTQRPIGRSDVHEVARLDCSIIRNLSQAEEIINFAAFPMMRKPMIERGQGTLDEAGPTAVLEFDPDNPNSKPDWLESRVAEPVNAILELIQRKVSEIYRASNAGGMASMEISSVAKSGAALTAEFQLLNSRLVHKAINLEKAERNIIWFWLQWMGLESLYDGVTIERSRSYDVQNLAQDLENSLTALSLVPCRKFNEAVQKGIARQMLPAATDEELIEIDKEIESQEEFAYRPRRAAEYESGEEQKLKIEEKKAAVDKVKAEAESKSKEDEKPTQPAAPAFNRFQNFRPVQQQDQGEEE